MDTGQLLTFIGIAIAAVPGILSFIFNQRTAATADRKVDAEAYGRAQKIYADALREVDVQLQRLRKENAELVSDNARLQKQLNELEMLVVRLRRAMTEHGINPNTIIDGSV